MALSPTEQAYLAEYLGLPSPNLVADELLRISASQELILQADIARWQIIRGKYGSLNGTGKDGVEFSPDDERSDIQQRAIRMLNCGQTVRRYAAWNAASGVTVARA